MLLNPAGTTPLDLRRPRPGLLILAMATVALLAAASTARPQTPGVTTRQIVSQHDFDSSSYTYCLLSDPKAGPNGTRVKTTGSSATVDAAAGEPFANVAAGDTITVQAGNNVAPVVRYVLTRASATQITVDTAVDWSGNGATGYVFSYRTLTCGTGAGAGWFGVSSHSTKTIMFQVDQLSVASGSLAVTIECKGASPWAQPTTVYPPNSGSGQCYTGLFTVAGATARCALVFAQEENYAACRLGVKLTDDAGDTGANLERVTATFEGR